jgi:hypothetical protein
MSTVEPTATSEVTDDDNLGLGVLVIFLLVLGLPLLLLWCLEQATDSINTAVLMSATAVIAAIVIESTRMP